MKNFKTRLKSIVIRTLFFSFYYTIGFIPVFLHEPMAKFLGLFGYYAVARHRRTVYDNLQIAFGDSISMEKKKEIAIGAYRNLTRSSLEFIRSPRFSREDVKRMADMEGKEHLDAALAGGKGALLISGHFGNWEMLAMRVVAEGYKLTVVGRDQDDSVINDIIVEHRTRHGTRNVPRGVPVYDRLLQCLRENELVGLVADQNAGISGLFVDFFGTKASSFMGPGLFAVKGDCPLIPLFVIRKGYDRHHVVIQPPLVIEKTGDTKTDVYRYTQAYVKSIEEMVRQYPDHWLWPHKRWKTRPPGEQEK